MRASAWLGDEPIVYVCDDCLLGFVIGEEDPDAFADRHTESCEGAVNGHEGD